MAHRSLSMSDHQGMEVEEEGLSQAMADGGMRLFPHTS